MNLEINNDKMFSLNSAEGLTDNEWVIVVCFENIKNLQFGKDT